MTRPARLTRRRDERGSVTVEAVVLIPALLLFVLLIVACGRVALARQAVTAAAADAARSASIARTAAEATTDAHRGAAATLANQRLHCDPYHVTLDLAGYARPVGTPATVTATVTCTITLADLGQLGLPGLPRQVTISQTTTSPLDTFRERR